MQIMEPYAQLLQNVTGQTSTLQTKVDVPLLDDYTFIAKTANTAGTSETLDINIQVSVDKGTTYFNMLRFAQFTTANGTKKIHATPYLKYEPNVTDMTKLAAAVADTDTNAVITGFFPATTKLAVNSVIGGTSPTYDITVWLIGNMRQML